MRCGAVNHKKGAPTCVPTVGVFQLADGASSQRFPVNTHRRFEAADAVDHSAYFRTPAAAMQILEWLKQDQ